MKDFADMLGYFTLILIATCLLYLAISLSYENRGKTSAAHQILSHSTREPLFGAVVTLPQELSRYSKLVLEEQY